MHTKLYLFVQLIYVADNIYCQFGLTQNALKNSATGWQSIKLLASYRQVPKQKSKFLAKLDTVRRPNMPDVLYCDVCKKIVRFTLQGRTRRFL